MNMQHLQIDELPEQTVVEYLRRHPEFFTNHEALLAKMAIPHARGSAISLVERQLAVLRDENQQLQRKLETLIAIAQKNEELNKRIQHLIVALSGALSAEEFFNILYDTLQTQFNTDAVTIRLFELPSTSLAGRSEFVEYDAQVYGLFENLLSTNTPVCGRISAEQRDYLFPEHNVVSAVLIPLGVPKPQGILSLGSEDISRFHAGMGTDLLKYMGELVSQLLKVWLRT